MVVLYILLGLLALIVWLLFVRVKVGICMQEETRIVVRYLFIRKTVLDTSRRQAPQEPKAQLSKPKEPEKAQKEKKPARHFGPCAHQRGIGIGAGKIFVKTCIAFEYSGQYYHSA